MSRSRVIVLGGGVIGSFCALYLRRAGCEVVLLERAGFGRGCSHGNCGYVCPSHVLPLAEPGAAWNAFRALFKRNSPFYIRPRLEWRLWNWLLRFASRCNHTDMIHAAEALAPLLKLSVSEYDTWISSGLFCEWQKCGLLFVYIDTHEFNAFTTTDRLLRERFDTSAQMWTRDELLAREPALTEKVAGAWFYPNDAQLRPDLLMNSLRRMLEREGVTIIENTPIKTFESSGGKLVSVSSTSGRFDADTYVIATGAWGPQFESELGLRIPIQPGKGYSITYERTENVPERPMIFHERRVATSTFQTGFRLGSTMEFSGYDESLNRRRLGILTRAAEEYLRTPPRGAVMEEWFGWRPMTYDSLPIIGPSQRLQNVFLAMGHGMLGVTLAPATGRLISELVCGTTPSVDPRPYLVQRFG